MSRVCASEAVKEGRSIGCVRFPIDFVIHPILEASFLFSCLCANPLPFFFFSLSLFSLSFCVFLIFFAFFDFFDVFDFPRDSLFPCVSLSSVVCCVCRRAGKTSVWRNDL